MKFSNMNRKQIMKNNTSIINIVTRVNTLDAMQGFTNRLMSKDEVSSVWEIVKTCDYARDNIISVPEEVLMQIQFDANAKRLGLSKGERFVFNRICCLALGIRHSFFNYKELVNKLLSDYPIASLYGMFRLCESAYVEHCEKFNLDGNVSLSMRELPLNSYTYMNNELILYVEKWLDFTGNNDKSWDEIGCLYKCSLESLVPVDYKSNSIAKACKRLFGESERRLEKYFGGSAFWLAVKCILSHKLRHKQAEVQSLFSPENYFAAKAFIAIYPTMKTSQKRIFIANDKYDKSAYMLQVLMNSKAQSKLFAEYLNASILILNQR